MQKPLYFLLFIILILCMSACSISDTPVSTGTTTPSTVQPSESMPTETTIAITPETEPTTPLHTDLYIEGVSTEQMILYFNEIVLSSEYGDNNDSAKLVQKWGCPIYYTIEGNATQEDLSTLNTLFEQLNQINGFPGIQPAEDEIMTNLVISFLTHDDFKKSFSDFVHGEDAYGAAQYWYYNASLEIHKGRIGYRTDISQDERTSVILEEIVNILGTCDSELRSNSIVYQHSNSNTSLSEIDWVILKLLYHPMINCGMNDANCKAALEQLYY